MPILSVPYYAQAGSGANQFRNDCLVTCCKMLISYTTKLVIPVDALARRTNLVYNKDTGLGVTEARGLLQTFGVAANTMAHNKTDGLKAFRESLDNGFPIILDVASGYRDIDHAIVLYGYDKGKGLYYLHDPYKPMKPLTESQLDTAIYFRSYAMSVRSTGRMAITSNLTVHRGMGTANLRDRPTLKSRVIDTLTDGERITFNPTEITPADGYNWLKLGDGRGWVAVEVV